MAVDDLTVTSDPAGEGPRRWYKVAEPDQMSDGRSERDAPTG
jgi:hypothetical protein